MHWVPLGLPLLLAACSGGENLPADSEWRLVALGDAGAPVESEGDATVEFARGRNVTGWSTCNSYSGRYSVRGSELHLDDLSWAEAGCPSQALFGQEQQMQDSLATIERFEVSDGRLPLHSEDDQVMVYERAEK